MDWLTAGWSCQLQGSLHKATLPSSALLQELQKFFQQKNQCQRVPSVQTLNIWALIKNQLKIQTLNIWVLVKNQLKKLVPLLGSAQSSRNKNTYPTLHLGGNQTRLGQGLRPACTSLFCHLAPAPSPPELPFCKFKCVYRPMDNHLVLSQQLGLYPAQPGSAGPKTVLVGWASITLSLLKLQVHVGQC